MYIVAFLLVAILVVLILMYRRQPAPPAPPPQPLMMPEHQSLLEATMGDALVIPGLGDNFTDLQVTVDLRNRYEYGGEKWFELSGRYKGRRVFVEVENDDDIVVLVNLANEDITLANLGITEEDLVRMDESHDKSQSFSYLGSQWRFDWSGEIRYFKGDAGSGEGYYNWDFNEQGGRRVLSVEKWEGEPFEVILSHRVNADDVQVFRS